MAIQSTWNQSGCKVIYIEAVLTEYLYNGSHVDELQISGRHKGGGTKGQRHKGEAQRHRVFFLFSVCLCACRGTMTRGTMDTDPFEKIVISASRRTDIPAFYMGWFMESIEEGGFKVQNPISGQVMSVQATPDKVHTIVFWSKNYGPFLKGGYGEDLVRRGFHLFFHFTINSEDPVLEPCIPSLEERLEQSRALSREFGSEVISWRFDPICFYKDKGKGKDKGKCKGNHEEKDGDTKEKDGDTKGIDRDTRGIDRDLDTKGRYGDTKGIDRDGDTKGRYGDIDADSGDDADSGGMVYDNLQDLGRIAEAMSRLGVRRCITSFMDDYSKIQKRIRRIPGFTFVYPEVQKQIEIVLGMEKALAAFSIDLYTCCEKDLLSSLPPHSRIRASSCIPNDLLQKLFGGHISLRSDRGQRYRQGCGCKVSRDIGSYRDQPCHHHCLYCYANPASK
jgi:hypothetical protein